MNRFIKKFVNTIGFDIRRHRLPREANLNIDEQLGYELEAEATECIHIVKDNTMLSKRRLVTLFQQVVYCEEYEIPGSFVECGVWKGGATGMMALANLRQGRQRRHLHLFDAFQDICEPDAAVDGARALQEVREFTGNDGHSEGKLQPVSGIYDRFGGPGTLEENQQLLEKTIGYPKSFFITMLVGSRIRFLQIIKALDQSLFCVWMATGTLPPRCASNIFSKKS